VGAAGGAAIHQAEALRPKPLPQSAARGEAMVAASRKEEERNERIVRGLLKLPPNRRCVNCNGLVRALSVSVLLRGPWLCLLLLIPWRRSMLITQYLCGVAMTLIQGPQYVCTSFWTFVCVSCSGIQ